MHFFGTKLIWCVLLIVLVFCSTQPLSGEEPIAKQFIYLDDWTYDLIDYWINSGALAQHYVLNQPYTLAEVQGGLSTDSIWRRLQKAYYSDFFGEPGMGKLILYGRDNYSFVSDEGLPKNFVLPQAPVDDVQLFENRTKNHFNFAAQLNFMLPHLSLVNRTQINSELKDDPRFFGDTGEWIFGRSNEAYGNINLGTFDLFLGRIDRNWGALSSPGLILSNNPYSYDHAQLAYTSDHVRFSLLVSRLEDMIGFSTEGLYPDSLFDVRRYMTAHRLDFSISPRFQFALTEVAIYGGPERDFEMGFLNPMNYFYLTQRNNQVEVNGLWAVDLFFKPHKRVNAFVQFLLDDIIVNNEPDMDDRANRPDRLGVTLKLSQADWWADGLQTGIEYTRIGNRTYQSFRTWENFHYREKGLGFPAASVERIRLQARYFNLFPAIFKLEAAFQRRGEVALTDAFLGFKDGSFPVGDVERTYNAQLDVRYFLSHWSQLTLKVGYERFENYRNLAGDDRTNFKLIIGAHLNWALKIGLD